eukprot:TRINITY_DN20643_c0_g1::TRINITY_DN20643_c0_g1_i1::g.9102::m.9102 TRINITY_DN20643_c0_g1::TRINITY_DN20643_c0_g1_i1::g.9102  ORF type:complete len:145 (+),score=-4.89,RNase_PH_C/PF03725.10/0.2 TRINITY_DN20643_c0_g1_i1:517-951(+)
MGEEGKQGLGLLVGVAVSFRENFPQILEQDNRMQHSKTGTNHIIPCSLICGNRIGRRLEKFIDDGSKHEEVRQVDLVLVLCDVIVVMHHYMRAKTIQRGLKVPRRELCDIIAMAQICKFLTVTELRFNNVAEFIQHGYIVDVGL